MLPSQRELTLSICKRVIILANPYAITMSHEAAQGTFIDACRHASNMLNSNLFSVYPGVIAETTKLTHSIAVWTHIVKMVKNVLFFGRCQSPMELCVDIVALIAKWCILFFEGCFNKTIIYNPSINKFVFGCIEERFTPVAFKTPTGETLQRYVKERSDKLTALEASKQIAHSGPVPPVFRLLSSGEKHEIQGRYFQALVDETQRIARERLAPIIPAEPAAAVSVTVPVAIPTQSPTISNVDWSVDPPSSEDWTHTGNPKTKKNAKHVTPIDWKRISFHAAGPLRPTAEETLALSRRAALIQIEQMNNLRLTIRR